MILTRRASKNTTEYIGSSGRDCQADTSAMTASVPELMNSELTLMPRCSAGKLWVSCTVIPRAYIVMILPSKPA